MQIHGVTTKKMFVTEIVSIANVFAHAALRTRLIVNNKRGYGMGMRQILFPKITTFNHKIERDPQKQKIAMKID